MKARTRSLDDEIDRVVRSGNCSGCGACALLDPGIRMALAPNGYNRPTRVSPRTGLDEADAVARFRAICPGVQVRAQRPPEARRHPTMGPVIEAFEAWATDEEIRFRGSSGGVLTALSAWLVTTGRTTSVVGAAAEPENPRRTVTVRITTRAEALAQAGSRYAPASNAAAGALDGGHAFVGKPCEVSALRALHDRDARGSGGSDPGPLLLSFFCAGTPSQHATDTLVEKLGVDAAEPVADLWYRGRGWPGRFTVRRARGETVDTSYDESWGRNLGPAVQWRCKVCVDGVGESADVTAADLWRADENGYPVFTEGAGVSAVIARTPRGLKVIREAIAAGVITATPIHINDLAAVQPLQRTRRETLAGRLAGTVLAGGRIPRYRGFGLIALAVPRAREVWRTAKGTYRRRRAKRNPDD